jgi:hypothetical protein
MTGMTYVPAKNERFLGTLLLDDGDLVIHVFEVLP